MQNYPKLKKRINYYNGLKPKLLKKKLFQNLIFLAINLEILLKKLNLLIKNDSNPDIKAIEVVLIIINWE